jgi:ribonuclease J
MSVYIHLRAQVDGLTIGGITQIVLRDRRRLAEDGVIICTLVVDRGTGELIAGPDLISRGVVDPAESDILNQSRQRIVRVLDRQPRGELDVGLLIGKLREVLSGYVYERTRRRPMILPVITEV